MVPLERSKKIWFKKIETSESKIFYAQIQCGSSALCLEKRHRAKLNLARYLIAAMDQGVDSGIYFALSKDLVSDLQTDLLGRPTIKLRSGRDISISFSYSPEKIWGAVSSGNSTCGIDVAFPSEFLLSYPYRRAFVDGEIDFLSSVHNFSRPEAASFLWSAKESLVKALGIGFHLCDPLNLFIKDARLCGEYFRSIFSISSGLRLKFSFITDLSVWIFTRREGDGFLSLSGVSGFPKRCRQIFTNQFVQDR